jgi:transcriptional regulator with XRE-family HTH domain
MIRAARHHLLLAFEMEKERRGFTQADLARELNVDRSVVNRRLMGHENLTIKSLAELADVLNRELVVDFLTRTELTGDGGNEVGRRIAGAQVSIQTKSSSSSSTVVGAAHDKHWEVA